MLGVLFLYLLWSVILPINDPSWSLQAQGAGYGCVLLAPRFTPSHVDNFFNLHLLHLPDALISDDLQCRVSSSEDRHLAEVRFSQWLAAYFAHPFKEHLAKVWILSCMFAWYCFFQIQHNELCLFITNVPLSRITVDFQVSGTNWCFCKASD